MLCLRTYFWRTTPYLFQYRGRQLKNIRTGFEAARINAGAPEQIFHDTRRTAVRNMVLAGISEKRAMQISGYRTRSVFDRYDITTERDAIETGKHMRRHWEQIAEQEATNASRADQSGRLGEKLGDAPKSAIALKEVARAAKLLN